MKAKKDGLITVVFFIILAITLILMITSRDSFHIAAKKESSLNLNQMEQSFLEKRDNVKLYVSPELQYLELDFLQEYVRSVLKPLGLKLEITTEEKEATTADGYLAEMTDEIREQVDDMQYSSPLFQTTGTLFVRQDLEYGRKAESYLKGIIVRAPLTERQRKNLSYDGAAIQLEQADSVTDAIVWAKKEELDCIIGNQEAIVYQLKQYGLQEEYIDTDSSLYTQNVCLITETQNAVLGGLINKCIENADKHLLLLHAEEKLGERFSNLLEENRYGNMAALLAIIVASVFITFFFYYETNKNMYNELAVRLNQLMASKKELQTTFDGISYYMAELDLEGYILNINRSFLNFVKKDCLNRHISQVITVREEETDALTGLLEDVRNNGRYSKAEVYFGNSILEIEGFPIEGPKGSLEKILFMAEDVTGKRMAERQLLQDNKMIAVGQLAAGMAHEIRNPLGVIRNYCYVLKNMKDEESQKKAVDGIERSVETSGKIIENLLNFSRVSNKTIESFFLRKHIDDLMLLNEGKLKKKNITAMIDCPEDLMVMLPEESFDMILLNLISNGVDAMEDGGMITIEVEVRTRDFRLLVTDTGCGIPEEIINDVFNPFFTTKYKTEGNGLGLYIVYNELTKLNGTIEVASKVGEGTAFTVTLPVRLEESSDE